MSLQLLESTSVGAIIVLAFLGSYGCSAPEFPDIPDQGALDLEHHLAKEGLSIWVDPFLEEERLQKFFLTDLREDGIVPVYVIAENQSERTYFVLEKARMALEPSSRETIAPHPRVEPSLGRSTATMLTGLAIPLGIVGGIFPIALVPILAVYVPLSMESQNKVEAVEYNLVRKELLDGVVAPRERRRGFVYFKLEGREESENLSSVCLEVTRLHDPRKLSFRFPLSRSEEPANE